jgi:CTP synthase
MIEIADHPWFVAVQFHPEYRSRAINPHPLFREFVKAAVERREGTVHEAKRVVRMA